MSVSTDYLTKVVIFKSDPTGISIICNAVAGPKSSLPSLSTSLAASHVTVVPESEVQVDEEVGQLLQLSLYPEFSSFQSPSSHSQAVQELSPSRGGSD